LYLAYNQLLKRVPQKTSNLAEPLNLPTKLAPIAVVVLAVGFPLAVILAWIYDLTPEGIEKTLPVEESKDTEQTKVPNTWRIATYVSFVVIVGLLTLNIVGSPRSLRAGDIQSLVILPFDNFTGDDALANLGLELDIPYMASNMQGYEHF